VDEADEKVRLGQEFLDYWDERLNELAHHAWELGHTRAHYIMMCAMLEIRRLRTEARAPLPWG